jgi:hypothetical protein
MRSPEPAWEDELATQLDAIVDAPFALGEYERWLGREPPSHEDYLFSETRARFEARDEDLLRAPDDLQVTAAKNGVELRSERLGGKVLVPGVSRASAQRVLALIDGHTSLIELRSLAGSERPALERLVQNSLGLALFVPEAVSALEARLSGVELMRFVGTPYEIVRNYWENMIDVRELVERTSETPSDMPGFTRWLRRLHVVLLMGKGLERFYRPASRITAQGVRPGALYPTATVTRESANGTLFLSGPRVGVALVGGEHYHALLCADDPEALANERTLLDEDGIPWGRVVTGRALDDSREAPWFCPPRPILPEHFAKLFAAYAAARQAADSGALQELSEQLARFHHRFVRLHPFRCANQSLSMNLVNSLLSRAYAAGMPHLLLDQLALRLSEPAYVRLFARAVGTHVLRGEPAQRWAALRQQKSRAYALIERLKAATDQADAERLVQNDPDGARAALLAS